MIDENTTQDITTIDESSDCTSVIVNNSGLVRQSPIATFASKVLGFLTSKTFHFSIIGDKTVIQAIDYILEHLPRPWRSVGYNHMMPYIHRPIMTFDAEGIATMDINPILSDYDYTTMSLMCFVQAPGDSLGFVVGARLTENYILRVKARQLADPTLPYVGEMTCDVLLFFYK